jgi:hypothetical protein
MVSNGSDSAGLVCASCVQGADLPLTRVTRQRFYRRFVAYRMGVMVPE